MQEQRLYKATCRYGISQCTNITLGFKNQYVDTYNFKSTRLHRKSMQAIAFIESDMLLWKSTIVPNRHDFVESLIEFDAGYRL